MNLKQKVARNVIWNWAGTATHMVAGFITFPVLIQRLGESDTGLWLLIVSLTGYFDLLDLGLRGSLGRNIAFFKARTTPTGKLHFNTGLALLGTGSLLVLLATAGAQFLFFDLFAVRPEARADVWLAIWLIGLNLALIFPFNAFESVLWGNQRFDLINYVDIPCVILRASLTIALVGAGSENLVTLALIILGITMLRGTGLAAFAFGHNRELRLGRRFVRWGTTRSLFDFGIWCFLLSIAHTISTQLGPLLIGNQLRIVLVTAFNAAARLVNYVKTILIASTGVLTPLATAWHATEEHGKQRWLFVNGGKVCLTLALFFLGGFWFLGDSFLRLWTGRELEYAWAMLMILMLGELLPLSQGITYSTVIGMNRHRLWAAMSMLEVVLILGLAAVFLMVERSVVSITLAVAIPGAMCRGLIQMIYGCRLLKVPLGQYLRQAMLPPVLIAAGPMALLGLLVWWRMPDNWLILLGFGMLYGLAYGVMVSVFLVGLVRLKSIAVSLLHKKQPPASGLDLEAGPNGEPVADVDPESKLEPVSKTCPNK
jgi:O-antigen/teichoic acid export membrane protein